MSRRIKLTHRWYDGTRVHPVGEIAEHLVRDIDLSQLPTTAEVMNKAGEWLRRKAVKKPATSAALTQAETTIKKLEAKIDAMAKEAEEVAKAAEDAAAAVAEPEAEKEPKAETKKGLKI